MKNGKHIPQMLGLLAIAVAALPRTSSACAVCMGASDSAVAPAMNAAIFLMLGFLGMMFAGVGGFVLYLYKRAKQPPAPHEELTQMIYQEGLHSHA